MNWCCAAWSGQNCNAALVLRKIRREKGKIWSPIRQKWQNETPEESVRQEFLCVLTGEYGFALEQMDEELEVTGRGSGHARADFVIWRTAQDKADSKNPLIIVECKSDNVTIKADDYGQGDNYSRLSCARFFVTHNSRETKFWRVVHEKMPKSLEEISNVPHADASNKEIEELLSKLKVFKGEEFADLLHQCHNVIRNREKLDPAAAFDEIAKILFVKVFVERELRAKRQRKNLFNVEFLDEQIGKHPLNTLFQQTKEAYEDDKIFEPDEDIRLRPATGREIVKLLGIVLPEGIFNNPSLAYVREFCENRAFIRAVVSLPQETFSSSGASVKASLLFLQKFTDDKQADFDAKHTEARADIEAHYADAIDAETARLEAAIAAAKDTRKVEERKALQKDLKDYQKRMADRITAETRALLKERFPYPIFLYEAEKVGITATGDADQNELIPNDHLPPGVDQPCLTLYQAYFLISQYDNMRALASGNNQPNLNAEMIANLRVPLPPLSKQKLIMARVASGRAEITREREAADTLARSIQVEIEALILGTQSLTDTHDSGKPTGVTS
jgi:hypothetical protein